MTVVFRPLGVVKEIVEAMGLTISFEYDDLLFIESNAFLVQFNDEKEKHINIYVNNEISLTEREKIFNNVYKYSATRELVADYAGTFEIHEKEGTEGELEIHTFPATEN